MQLQIGALLQGGKYKIESVLGQGGFGITYLATQVGLNRRVAIKEFFMKEYCERNAETSQVALGTSGSRELVDRFRSKFIKEAQNIACLKHPYIISIYDVFEDNGTAYYVMEYLDRGSLAEMVKQRGRLTETDALRYIRQIADALSYIHERKMNHLDVKPGNILIDETDHAVLIDFGLSKRYDDEGNQTSTTPVGISHGYAPLEQYKKGGVGTFSPATDIYSLGATLYKLITGDTPPDANDVNDEGLSAFPSYVSPSVASAIEQAMQPRSKDRPQTIEAFLALLDAKDAARDDEETLVVKLEKEHREKDKRNPQKQQSKKWLWPLVACIAAAFAFVLWLKEDAMRQEPTGIIYGHEYVDLGLSVMWATCNVGASSPSDYGNYYAWGETKPKSIYTESQSFTYGLSEAELKSRGIIGSDGNLTSAYDAASVNWGGTWRMPTFDEIKELKEKCSWVWTSMKGVKGYKATGPNGNSIFLPAAGCRYDTSLNSAGFSGYYWSATLFSGSYYAYSLYFSDGNYDWIGYILRDGLAVRPVSE